MVTGNVCSLPCLAPLVTFADKVADLFDEILELGFEARPSLAEVEGEPLSQPGADLAFRPHVRSGAGGLEADGDHFFRGEASESVLKLKLAVVVARRPAQPLEVCRGDLG